MNKSEFINKVLHKPWVNRAESWDALDCWGLVIMYYRHVLRCDLPIVTGYANGECTVSDGVNQRLEGWERVDKPIDGGVIFIAFDGDTPEHVGIMISKTKVLHSRGSEATPGSVSIHSLAALKSRYNRIEFYIYRGLNA